MRHKPVNQVMFIIVSAITLISPSMGHAGAAAEAVNIGKKILGGAGSVLNAAGILVGAVDFLCKSAKGKSWQPSMCKDSKLAEKINDMTIPEMEEFLQLYIRKLPADKKQAFLKALYEDLSDDAKKRIQNSLSEEEIATLDIKVEKTAQTGNTGTAATKSIRSIAEKIIARKTFSIQLIYCDNAKQASCNGKKLPMGSIQCGANYRVRYDHPVRSFEVTGPEKGSGQQQTSTYSGAKVEDGQVSLWGRFLTFDEEGDILDSDCGRVGRLAFE